MTKSQIQKKNLHHESTKGRKHEKERYITETKETFISRSLSSLARGAEQPENNLFNR
jgi:hypothetical protein